ncbi:MAG: glycosyltransferase [Planctomycetota bacterium]|nr:glycosyltransferase [Planctomycetota bacterium]
MSTTINNSCTPKKVLAVDFEFSGHHPAYIENIARIWSQSNINHSIEFLLCNRFKELHNNIVKNIKDLSDPKVTLRFISKDEESLLANPKSKYWNAWKLFCKYAIESKVSDGLILFLDLFQLSIWLGQKSPVPFSGIYFRPTFHYGLYQGFRPTVRDRLVGWRKAFLLQRVLKKPQLMNLLSVDSTAVPYIREHFSTSARIAHFPDSFDRQAPSDQEATELKTKLGIEPGRMVFCLIGVLDNRKGPMQLLNAIRHLPDDVAQKICILLAGRTAEGLREQVVDAVLKLKSYSKSQVVLHDKYIPPSKILTYYKISDVILTTYQFHKGSSSALIHAAHENKPVLSSDYGWLGHIVRTYSLGIDIESNDSVAIANGITKFARSDPSTFLNQSRASELLSENSQEKLAMELTRLVCPTPSNTLIADENA